LDVLLGDDFDSSVGFSREEQMNVTHDAGEMISDFGPTTKVLPLPCDGHHCESEATYRLVPNAGKHAIDNPIRAISVPVAVR